MRRKRASAAPARTPGRTGRGGPELMLDINTTPLIDVMLVLLVMLIITIPIQLHAVHLELPVGAAPVPPNPPPLVRIDIAADGSVHWQGTVMSTEELDRRMALAARDALAPEIQVRAHKDSRYAVFAAVLSASRRHGLAKVAVVVGDQLP